MTTRPWMPLYIADYLADTAHLNAAQSGAYLHLIMHYWQTGGLPGNDDALARIARMTPTEWHKNRNTIAAFFADGWKHKRIDAELAHVVEVSNKRRASAEQRYSKRDANAEQKDTHSHSHSDSHNKKESPASQALASATPPIDLTEALEIYNRAAKTVGWPKAQVLTQTREKHLRQRLRECGGVTGWTTAIERGQASNFLTGGNDKGWHADLDFFLQAKSFTKLMEGSYDNHASKNPKLSAHDKLLRAVAERFAPQAGAAGNGMGADGGSFDDPGGTSGDSEKTLDLGRESYVRTE